MSALDEFTGEQWIIEGDTPNKVVLTIIGLISCAAWLFAFSSPVTLMINWSAIPQDFRMELLTSSAVQFIVVGVVAALMSRFFLWNMYGQEIITLDNRQLKYEADYRLYKARSVELDVKKVEFDLIVDNEGYPMQTFKCADGDAEFFTVLKADMQMIEEIQIAIAKDQRR
ncbi:MAG: hypothetical protein AAF193_04325 [Bacteroidota bacterium]